MRYYLPLVLSLCSSTALAGVGTVTDVGGNATIERSGTANTLRMGSTIEQHDIIHTSDDSFVSITFKDETELRLGEDTRLTIDEYVYDSNTDEGSSELSVSEGFFRFISGNMVKNNPDAMVYRTPVATLGIRGTEAFAEVRKNGATLVGMTECCVDLASSSGTSSLKQKNTFSAVMKAGASPTQPSQCPPRWLETMGVGLGLSTDDRLYGNADSLWGALTGGVYKFNARYRWEHVNQDGIPNQANASTLGTRLHYQTANYHGFNAGAELESTLVLGHNTYNDTENGRTRYPVVPDAESYELNQLYIGYSGTFPTHFRIGRQAVNFDNQRFIGSVAFRQDSQTHDAIVISDQHIDNLTATYGYVHRVNRIFSEQSPNSKFDTSSHLAHLHYTGIKNLKLSAYGYLLDVTDFPGASTQTYGLRAYGFHPVSPAFKLLYTAEYATQLDYADNPANFDETYLHFQLGGQYKQAEVILGYEHLGGDGTNSVATPLATLHIHNGLTDQFLTTPAAGLIDQYIKASYQTKHESTWLNHWKLTANYHNFDSDQGSINYGSEWGIGISKRFAQHYSFSLAYADYDANNFNTDTEKLWLTLSYSY